MGPFIQAARSLKAIPRQTCRILLFGILPVEKRAMQLCQSSLQ
jgi:hypothetical protein